MPKYYTVLPFQAVRENIALASEVLELSNHFDDEDIESAMLYSLASDLVKGLMRDIPEPDELAQILPMDSETLLDALLETKSNTILGIAKYACRTVKEVRKALDLGLLNGYVTKTGANRSTKYFASEK